jgi:hypothetical protein
LTLVFRLPLQLLLERSILKRFASRKSQVFFV